MSSVHLLPMDANWFKRQHKIAGVTVHDLGEAIGRDRAIVSRIYTGRQKMTFDQAQVFAELLKQPLSEILAHAGLTDTATAQSLQRGFSESDAAAWIPKEGKTSEYVEEMAKALGAGQEGREIWRVKSRAMAMAGYLEGDFILVDQRSADQAKSGDVVIAQVYDWDVGSAVTLLRRYEPPVLAAASTDPADWKAHVVDHRNVKIMGLVKASWRVP